MQLEPEIIRLEELMAEKKDLQEQNQGLTEEREAERIDKSSAKPEELPLAIVGIGASAGGLESLEKFFRNMPASSGMAFVVIQHQNPEQSSLLPEILQRYTEMPVTEIEEDGLKALPDRVYVKPPNHDLSIIQGRFALLNPITTLGAKTSIDSFLRQLAEDQGEKAVGIVLSGMGNDGTLGIRAMKEHMGMAMAQEPSTAQFDAMPKSAISTGLVDYIAPAEELPQRLIDYVRSRSVLWKVHAPRSWSQIPESSMAKVFALIRSRTGQDFSQYKRSTITRRIERRMGLHQITHLNDYIRYIKENPPEVEILAKEMLIGVTQLFRDPPAWEHLSEVLSGLIQSKADGQNLRLWVVGCSTGEEAYSMAIVLQELLEALEKMGEVQFQIFATDTDSEAIDIARSGRYPANIEADVSPSRLERFFIKENGTYRINASMREKIIFAPHNIARNPPFTHLDIISCRNLMIYLMPELQKTLIYLFHYALNPGGILFLGTAESIIGYNDLFSTLDSKWKIFKSSNVPDHGGHSNLSAIFTASSSYSESTAPKLAPVRGSSITVVAQEQLLERYAPPAVIVTKNGDIVYFHWHTGKYLELSSGKANLNLFNMAREGLRYSILSALRTASSEKHEVVMVMPLQLDASLNRVRLTVLPLPKRSSMVDLYLVAFDDVKEPEPCLPERTPAEHGTEASMPDVRLAELERELVSTREQLQQMAEEKQSFQEEMISMNEEMQSANEELNTSKEELHSANEELLTVNAELKSKIKKLNRNEDDMRNLLQSTKIPIFFLDRELKVRRYTEEVHQVAHLIGADIGRPITDLKLSILGESVVEDLRKVLDTLQSCEKQVKTTDQKWFLMRALPYRTSENRIDGLVVIFIDITAIKQLEQSIKAARNYAESIVATILEPLVVLDSNLRVISANRSFYMAFQVEPEDTEGRLFYDIGNKQWDIPQLRDMLEDILKDGTSFEGYRIEHDFPEIGWRAMLLNARKIRSDPGTDLILLAIEDVTKQFRPDSQAPSVRQQNEIEGSQDERR